MDLHAEEKDRYEYAKLQAKADLDKIQTMIDKELADIQRHDDQIDKHNTEVADRAHEAEQAELDRQHEADLTQRELDAQPPAPADA